MERKNTIVESEKTLDKKLVRKVRELGGLSIKLSALHFTGLPDRMCLVPGGKIAFAEMKGTGEEPSRIQKTVHKKLRGLGFVVDVVDSTDTLNIFLKNSF